MAVMSRTSNTKELEECLVARGVPYTMEGAGTFFSRPEVQAPLALLGLCANPLNNAAFQNCLSIEGQGGRWGRGGGAFRWTREPKCLSMVWKVSREACVPIVEAVRLCVDRGMIEGSGAKEMSAFVHALRRWSGLLVGWACIKEQEREATVRTILWEAGLLPSPTHLPPNMATIASERRGEEQSVSDLATAASRYVHLEQLLRRAASAQSEDRFKGGGGRRMEWSGTSRARLSVTESDAVEVMTMHQAKGREFKVVFLTG
ncbi:unnamed protein product, partial [Choristocarpus tenellus]